MKTRAVFLDRDGTVNIDPGYLGNPDLVKLYPGVSESILKLRNKFEFKIVVVSNQSGISRGLITSIDVERVNNKINEILSKDGASIDAFYFCPFHPDFDSEDKCTCRKPSPEMIFNAVEDFNIDLELSYLIGNSKCDIECGINAGIKSILVKTTLNDEQIKELHCGGIIPNFVANDFKSACNFIYSDILGG